MRYSLNIFMIIVLTASYSCKTIEKKEKKFIVKKSLEDSVLVSEKVIKNLVNRFSSQSDINIGYELKDKQNTIIKISSNSEQLIYLTKNAFLQEIYLADGGVITEGSQYKEKSNFAATGLSLLNSGLGLLYITDNNILQYKRSDPALGIVLFGLADALSTVLFIYGLDIGNSLYTYNGLGGMLISKSIAFLAIGNVKIHNQVINSGYNFDKGNTMNYTFLVKEF